MNIYKKEIFREFEFKRFINLINEKVGYEESAESTEAQAPDPELVAIDEAAETPDKSKEAAKEAAEKTSEEGEKIAEKAGVDPEKGEESTTNNNEASANSPSNQDVILSSLFDDPKIRFEVMEFIGRSKDEANSIDKQTFIKDLKIHRNFSNMLNALREVDTTEPFELNKKNREAIVKAIGQATDTESLSGHNTEEVNILKKAPTSLEGGATLEGLLGEEGLVLLSMNYEIKADEKNEAASIKIDGKWLVLNDQDSLDTVVGSLPDHIQEAYANKVNDPETYKKLVIGQLKANKSIIELKQAIEGGKSVDVKKMDWSGYLKMIMQIMPMIKKAMEGNEVAIKDLTDAYNHFDKTGENPLDAMDAAKTAYTSKLGEMMKNDSPSTLTSLLSMHANPHGQEADNAFYTADGPMKFRSQLESAIESTVITAMSGNGRVELQSMDTSADGNSSKIGIVKNGSYYDVDVYKVGSQFKMNLNQWSSGENAQIVAQSEAIPINGVGEIGAHFNALQPVSNPTPTAATEGAANNQNSDTTSDQQAQ